MTGQFPKFGSDEFVWSGLSTEDKPRDAFVGQRIIETDTGNEFVWTGLSWQRRIFKGAVNIHDSDTHDVIVNRLFNQPTLTETTLTVSVIGDGTEYQITVDDDNGFAAGDFIHLDSENSESTILQIVGTPASNVITLDRKLDKAHSIGSEVVKSIVDLSSQVGSLASPEIYFVKPQAGEIWHLTRILFEMTHSVAGDLGLFGGISPLTNGVIVRAKISGKFGTLTNWKHNGNIKTDMFDVVFDSRSGGQGAYGTSGRGDFKSTGSVLKLNGDNDDQLQLYIQDDITALDSFTMKAQGHFE